MGKKCVKIRKNLKGGCQVYEVEGREGVLHQASHYGDAMDWAEDQHERSVAQGGPRWHISVVV